TQCFQPVAVLIRTLPNSYIRGLSRISHIDSFRATCAHEKQHYDDSRAGYDRLDTDGDLLADHLEDANGNGIYEWELGETYWRETDSFHDQLPDNRNPDDLKPGCDNDKEWRGYQAELTVQLGQYDEHDWTVLGPNWDR
ncbi:MAG: hypothetical protein ACOC2T_00580, partial [Planctomycetota bacterium]